MNRSYITFVFRDFDKNQEGVSLFVSSSDHLFFDNNVRFARLFHHSNCSLDDRMLHMYLEAKQQKVIIVKQLSPIWRHLFVYERKRIEIIKVSAAKTRGCSKGLSPDDLMH